MLDANGTDFVEGGVMIKESNQEASHCGAGHQHVGPNPVFENVLVDYLFGELLLANASHGDTVVLA